MGVEKKVLLHLEYNLGRSRLQGILGMSVKTFSGGGLSDEISFFGFSVANFGMFYADEMKVLYMLIRWN